MGYATEELVVSMTVSKHNSPQDTIDRASWMAFAARVKLLAQSMDLDIGLENYPGDY